MGGPCLAAVVKSLLSGGRDQAVWLGGRCLWPLTCGFVLAAQFFAESFQFGLHLGTFLLLRLGDRVNGGL